MVREILFKAKRSDGKGWVEGDLVTDGKESKNNLLWIFPDDADEYDFNLLLKVIPETVCQYTGLKDKNGEKIFEWDFINVKIGDYIQENIVVWDSFGWCISTVKDASSLWLVSVFDQIKIDDSVEWFLTGKNIHDEK